jgi:hypothetical protein
MLAPLAIAVALIDPPRELTGHCGVCADDKMYVVGGMGLTNMGSYYPTLWQVDPRRSIWKPLAKMRVARAMAGAALLNGSIYVAGGMVWAGGSERSVERFDLGSGRWTDVAPLNRSRNRFPLVALAGKLYAISGMKGEGNGADSLNTASIEEYDPKKNVWREAGALNHARHGFSAVTWNDRIYVFGGNDSASERSGEEWDPKTGKSIDLPTMPVPRGFGGAIVKNGQIICFGGRQTHDRAHPSAFDPATGKWSQLSIPDIDLCRFVSGAIAGKLWIVGGEADPARPPILQSIDLSSWK